MKIAFNTANLVARATGYRFSLSNWGQQHQLTVEHTDAREFAAICTEIASAGFTAVELWVAHADPSVMTPEKLRERKKILADHRLTPIGLAAPLTRQTADVCLALDIPCCNGGLWGTTLAEVKDVIRATGLRYNYENHPEKSAAEIIARIDGGSDTIGVAVDTGWFGTQQIDAATAIKTLGSLVRHLHVKDVATLGQHDTCLLGQGVVNLPTVMSTLKTMGYTGWYSWEDEPEHRNPFDSAVRNRQWIQTHAGA